MSVRTASELMAGPIGRDLARSDDETQAEFFNEFARALWTACGGEGHFGWDSQQDGIVRRLDPRARALVKGLAAFIALDEEDVS